MILQKKHGGVYEGVASCCNTPQYFGVFLLLKVVSHLTVQFRCPKLVGDFSLQGDLGSRLLPSHGSAIP